MSFSIYSKAIKETGWQMLPVDSDSFEASVRKVCELIKRGDQRIGKIPRPGKKQKPGIVKPIDYSLPPQQ